MVLYIGHIHGVLYGHCTHWVRGVIRVLTGTAHGMRGWHVHPVVVVVGSGGTTVAIVLRYWYWDTVHSGLVVHTSGTEVVRTG